jgi:hypothetical protein
VGEDDDVLERDEQQLGHGSLHAPQRLVDTKNVAAMHLSAEILIALVPNPHKAFAGGRSNT